MYISIIFLLLIEKVYSFNLPSIVNPIITSSELITTYSLGKLAKDNIPMYALNSNITRKLIHVTSAPVFVSTWGLYNNNNPNSWASLVPLSASIYIATNSEKLISLLSRKGTKEEIFKGPLVYTIILTLITYFSWMNTSNGIVTIMQLAIGDGFSDIVGRAIGETKWKHNNKKSIEGSIAFLVTSFFSSVYMIEFFNLVYKTNYEYSLINLLIISLSCSLMETIPDIDDNVSVPIASIILSELLL
jgi:dolichol kinase